MYPVIRRRGSAAQVKERSREHGMRRLASAAAIVAVLVLAGTACTGKGGGKAQHGNTGGGQQKGGTLYVNAARAFTHLDPQRNYYGDVIDFESRTIVRTLTTFPA